MKGASRGCNRTENKAITTWPSWISSIPTVITEHFCLLPSGRLRRATRQKRRVGPPSGKEATIADVEPDSTVLRPILKTTLSDSDAPFGKRGAGGISSGWQRSPAGVKIPLNPPLQRGRQKRGSTRAWWTCAITGGFNPEIFTASLSAVLEHYKGGATAASAVYTDAAVFFGQATYPTNGMRQVIGDVYCRLSGDLTAPAVHRLETGFGGGKTHTLIDLMHIAKWGKSLAGVSDGVLSPDLLPEPGDVIVVGIVGDELPVQEVKGSRLQPYTLWGKSPIKSEARNFIGHWGPR